MKQRVIKVVKERGFATQLVMLLVAAVLIALVPPLIMLLAAYAGFKAFQLIKHRRPKHSFATIKLRTKWPLPLSRVKASCLKKLGSLQGCELYIPSEDPTCLLTLKGFTLTGSGFLYLKPLEPYSIDVRPLINAAIKMRRQLLLAFIVDPSRRGRLKVSIAAFVSVRSLRWCLRVDDEQVRGLVEEVERCLDGVRAVMMSQPQHLELDVLKGDDLVGASMLLVGAVG